MTSQALIRRGCAPKHTLAYGVEATGESHESFDPSKAREKYKIPVLCSTSLKKWIVETTRPIPPI
jgi:hypothetical protein